MHPLFSKIDPTPLTSPLDMTLTSTSPPPNQRALCGSERLWGFTHAYAQGAFDMATAFSFAPSYSQEEWRRAWDCLCEEQPLLRAVIFPNTHSLVHNCSPGTRPTFSWVQVGEHFSVQEGIDHCLKTCDFSRLRLTIFAASTAEHLVFSNPHALLDAPTLISLTVRLYQLLSLDGSHQAQDKDPRLPPSIYDALGAHVDAEQLPTWLSKAVKVSADMLSLSLTLSPPMVSLCFLKI